ncbi:hypothetical protein [Roseococcus pinisoli]|uniref:Uncharacterized protein n=1 Tax=Roseococcus pinisoli TaxID=2835040 RepID=A0ABS5QA27_9PROT|nr:hypothetical protein [Roseococcus pinisoli]MBS7810556.1 hypothetical protein [Roseococcus pinisoli]
MAQNIYTATICHSSIASAPEIQVVGTLQAAKRAATIRFAGGYSDHDIVIHDREGYVVASRSMNGRWLNR